MKLSSLTGLFSVALVLAFISCQAQTAQVDDSQDEPIAADVVAEGREVLTLGAGCFWCVEVVFARIEGIEKAISGYMGGTTLNPTYKQITTGKTGHAEVVRVEFDPEKVSTEQVLRLFFELHDPTQLNRQGNDIGTQYRSAIFFHNEEQKQVADALIAELNEAKKFPKPIVTEVTEASTFYHAEAYHQDFWESELGQRNGYCRAIIPAKLEKLGLTNAPVVTKE